MPKELTYSDLTRRLWDIESLAVLPAGETGAQFSSYDRRSRYDETTGRYLDWGANEDQMDCLRFEGEDAVLAEMNGPGCIWRIWSATPKEGHIRIYLDGNPEPAIDLPFTGFFDRQYAPFDRPELVYVAARGFNNYTPIPYQKSCKIVVSPGWGRFYHFNYTTFPEGTKLPTFHRELSAADAVALDEANAVLANRGSQPGGPRPGQETVSTVVTASPGQAVTVISLNGERAITGFRAKISGLPATPEDRKALRNLSLKMTWDDAAEPAVWAPWGDFFGSSVGAHPLRSLPCGLSDDGEWYAYWYMPFAKSAHVEVVNDGDTAFSISLEISHAPLQKPAPEYGRFHAKWHRDAFPQDDLDRTIDWTLLKTSGAGRYVGTVLHIWNPRRGWWGEGDEKFFVDGEKFPSTFGTGSEDYFGYAWCSDQPFDQALHGQSAVEPDNLGHTSLHRWHLADNIPFQHSFDGYMEKYFSNRRPTLYAATVYWYLAANGNDPYQPASAEARSGYLTDFPLHTLPTGRGCMEADSMEVKCRTGGRHGVLVTPEFEADWSTEAGRELCLWIDGKPGDTLELKVHWFWGEKGRHRVSARFIKSPAAGIVQPYLNENKAGDLLDLYAPEPTAEQEIDLGIHELSPGIPILKFEIIGANPSAQPHYGLGLDYIRIVKEP